MTSELRSRRKPRGPSLLAMAATAACVFLIVLTFLALQLRAGHDPALGTVASSAPAAQVAAPAAGHSRRRARHEVVGRHGRRVPACRPGRACQESVRAAPVTRSSGG